MTTDPTYRLNPAFGPSFRSLAAGDINIPASGPGLLTCNTPLWDTDTCFDGTAFVCKVPGIYRFNAGFTAQLPFAGQAAFVALTVNGTPAKTGAYRSTVDAGPVYPEVTSSLLLKAGDVVRAEISTDAAAVVTIPGATYPTAVYFEGAFERAI